MMSLYLSPQFDLQNRFRRAILVFRNPFHTTSLRLTDLNGTLVQLNTILREMYAVRRRRFCKIIERSSLTAVSTWSSPRKDYGLAP